MGSCQNYGPCLGTQNIRGRIILRTPKGIIILKTTHMIFMVLQGRKSTPELTNARPRALSGARGTGLGVKVPLGLANNPNSGPYALKL